MCATIGTLEKGGNMPPNCKITTFSLMPDVIEKLNKLQEFWHMPNKSRILALLIEREYNEQVLKREVE